MNKKLAVALMATGFVLPFAAHADVNVFGIAQAELSSFTNEAYESDNTTAAANHTGNPSLGAADTARGDEISEHDAFSQSRFGVTADEDLGDGLKGIAKYEWKVDPTDNYGDKTGTISLVARESYVGLQGGFGTVEMGRLKSAYKYMGGVTYDAFVATSLEARSHGGMSNGKFGHGDFLANHIGWYSPKMSGVDVMLTYRLDDGGTTATHDAAELAGEYTFGVRYDRGPMQFFVAMANDGEPTTGTDAYAATKVGGQYKGGPITVNLQYEMIDNKGTDVTILFLGGAYAFGKSAVHLQFGSSSVDADTTDDVTYMMLALRHKFSKTTSTWIGYRSTTDYDTVISVGLRKDFSS